jgi:hypothetical protein
MISTLDKTFFYPAYAIEDLIESWSGTTESPSLKKIFTCPETLFCVDKTLHDLNPGT